MMITVKNNGGALRVVYDANGKQQAIPPNSSVQLLLSDATVRRMTSAMNKGDTLLIEEPDFQPREDPPIERMEFKDEPVVSLPAQTAAPITARPRARSQRSR